MSSFGLSPNGNRAQGATDVTGNNNGIAGPARDAWNNPIKDDGVTTGGTGDNKINTNTTNDTNTIDDGTINDIWDQVKKENSGTKVDDKTINVTVAAPVTAPDPKKQMDDYLGSVGLEPITLNDAEKEELKAGNFDNLMVKFNQKIVNAHVKALSGANTMMEDKIKKAVEQAVNTTQALSSGAENVRALNAALPFTKDKAIGPVAQTVMQKFLDRGMNTEEAIKGVKKFFDHTSNAVSGNQVNTNRNGNFRGGPENNDDGSGNWLDILAPKRQG